MRPYDRLLTLLSLSRVGIAAAIILIFDPLSQLTAVICVGLYVLGHVTDHLDGYIARRFSQPNDKGFMLDSVSDKLFQIGCLIPIHLYFDVTIILFWIVLVREFFVIALFSFIDFSDDETVRHISKYSYFFVGAVRLATVIYFSIPVIQTMLDSAVIENIQTAAFGCYVAAVAVSTITVFDMYWTSKRGSSKEPIRRARNGKDSNS